MTFIRAKYGLLLLVPLLLALHLLSTHRVQHFRNSLEYQNTINAPLLPDSVMKMVAGEFKGLAADFLLLEISAFIDAGTHKSDADWERISFHFSQVMALDPYFSQSYRMIQAFLPWKGKVEEANALLEIARQHLPWDWYPGFYIGFNYFNEFQDYAKASVYITEASKIDGAPAILATLGARLAHKSGQTVTAVGFLKTMLRNPDYDEDAKAVIEARISVLEGVLLLERAIEVYEKRFGRSIQELKDLVRAGIIKELPENKEFRQYQYKNGKVTY